jgi:ABC transporter related protein
MKNIPVKSKRFFVLTCLLSSMESVALSLSVYYTAQILEFAQEGQRESMIWRIVIATGLLLSAYLLHAGSTAARLGYLSHAEVCLKRDIMKNVLRRPWQGFQRRNRAYYLNLFTTDTDMYRTDRMDTIPLICSYGISAVVASVMLCLMNTWLFVAGILVSTAPLICSGFFTNIQQRTRGAFSARSEEYANVLKETIDGYEVIHTSNQSGNFLNRFEQVSSQKQRAYFSYGFARSMSAKTLYTIASLTNIIGIGVGGFLILQGSLSAAMMLAATGYFSEISNSLSNLIEEAVTFRSTKELAKKLEDERDFSCPVERGLVREEEPAITYHNVSFSFDQRQLYRDFCHVFRPGGCYAIVGESGSGKTTLIKLLLKYYDNYTGEIYFGNQDIKNATESEILAQISVVNQSAFLFNASLYENITMFGQTSAQDSAAYQALLEELNLTDLAKRVGEKPLGDFGDHISGGERQRICIARAMQKHASVMVFDEPTTGLDPENVKLIQEFIFRQKHITRIVITHDWSKEYLDRFDEVIRVPGAAD